MDSNAAETRAAGERSGFSKAVYVAPSKGGRVTSADYTSRALPPGDGDQRAATTTGLLMFTTAMPDSSVFSLTMR